MTTAYELLLNYKNWRLTLNNEIVFDIDSINYGSLGINHVGWNLYYSNYNFEIWKAEGQKSPHLHIKDIQGLEALNPEQLKKYKELFLKKYCSEEYHQFLDLSLCSKHHPIAQENKLHFKYGTVKKLLSKWNQDNKNHAEEELIEIASKEPARTLVTSGTGITSQIINAISIIDLAREIGIEVNTNGFAVCPFHVDNNPSLKFYEVQGRFICFGCQKKGNIIDFIHEMRRSYNVRKY